MVSMDRREASYRGSDIKIFIRDVRDPEGKKRAISVRSWATIKDVKDILKELLHVPPFAQRLYFGPLLTSRGELPNHRTLHDAGIYRSGETLLLDIKGASQDLTSPFSSVVSLHQSNDICISSSMFDVTPRPLRAIVQKARRGFAVGLKPEFILDGSGGTYFLHDARKNKIAVFKPADEEPYAENNPRGYIQQPNQSLSLREGIVPGEACIREVAAYLLDHNGFSGVPMTTLAEARHPAFNSNGSRLTVAEGGACMGSHCLGSDSHPNSSNPTKAGSFQEFVRCNGTMDDISPSKLSVEEVHKIAILDIRIMNADRNSANLLVRRRHDNSLQLVPIDHGFCLRSVCDVSWMDWCWLDWPQLKKPLSDSHKKYIEHLDIEADAQLLRDKLNICQEAIDYFRASSSLLKAGVKAGLTLYDIAILCCRNDNLAEIPSMMENLFSMASELALAAVENERWHHTAASLAIEEKLTPERSTLTAFKASFSTGHRMRKSSSAAVFLALESNDSFMGDTSSLNGRESPGMAQSSASDSSSEAGDAGDKEECDEWAEGIIADVAADKHIDVLPSRPNRSGSVASDDGSTDSGSRKGFWHVRPGSSPPCPPSDDGSISWSPQSSPRPSMDISEQLPTLVSLPGTKSHRVSFSNMPSGPFIPPSTVNIRTLPEDSVLPKFIRQESGLTRSVSYSSMPRAGYARQESVTSKSRPPNPYSETYENYRKYFHKFIDLVIVRETTTAAVRQSRVN